MSKKVVKNFVMTQAEADLIAKKAQEMGDASDSAAFRAIVREWDALKSQEYARLYSQPNPLVTVDEAQSAYAEKLSPLALQRIARLLESAGAQTTALT